MEEIRTVFTLVLDGTLGLIGTVQDQKTSFVKSVLFHVSASSIMSFIHVVTLSKLNPIVVQL